MWTELLAIAGGFVLLAWSADRFVASAMAYNLKVSPLVIGLTIVGLGTSAPEMLVSALASWQGNSGLAVGNALGSNIINTGLILGFTAMVIPLNVHSSILKRELPVLLLVMAVALLLLMDGTLGRLDGILLLAGMVVMLIWMIRLGRTSPTGADPMSAEFADEIPTTLSMGRAVFWLIVGGLVLLGPFLIACVVGICIGVAAGSCGGVIDEVLMRVTDGLLAFPRILLVLLLVALFSNSFLLIVLV